MARRSSADSRILTATRSASSPTTASCSRSRRKRARTSSSSATAAAFRSCSCRTSRASWSGRRVEHGGIAKDGAKMVNAVATASRTEIHGHHRRFIRRRQLRDVRPRLRPAHDVDVAERADIGHGRRAGGARAVDRQARGHGGARRGMGRRRNRRVREAHSRNNTTSRVTRIMRAPGSGTTASSTRSTPARCSARRCRRR